MSEKTISPIDLKNEGYLMEVNRRFFHPLGLAMFVNDKHEIGVYDWRHDSEGGAFITLAEDEDLLKYENIESQWIERAKVREERFGWMVQPIGSIIDDAD